MASTSTSAPTSSDILDNARFSTRSSSPSVAEAPTASSILSASIDPSSLHPLAGIIESKDLDYLLLDDDKLSGVEGGKTVLPSRGWGDELCYGTGSTYLAGLGAGGLWGLREGFRKPVLPKTAAAATASVPLSSTVPPASAIGAQATAFAESSAAAAAAGSAPAAEGAAASAARGAGKVSGRVKWNNILNQVTRRGTFAGNSAGVLALIYNGFNSTLDAYRGGKHDIYGSMFAGAATGAVWKSTAGLQPMIISSGLMMVGAAAWTKAKAVFL
ncbi:hypothetical protein MNV49_005416 [Pseudohyphozyma bogoriensis]|nr:hypothetical protein MNV49_005416 [Pseudohyphozyma bogoriensis]